MKKILTVLVIAIAALPIAGVVTILLTPFWRWFEATTHLESIGHSGPANWCFVGIYALTLLTWLTTWLRFRPR